MTGTIAHPPSIGFERGNRSGERWAPGRFETFTFAGGGKYDVLGGGRSVRAGPRGGSMMGALAEDQA